MTTVQALVLVHGHAWDTLYLTGGSTAFAYQLGRQGWLLEAIRGERRCFVRRRANPPDSGAESERSTR